MKKGVLLINESYIAGKQLYFGYALVEGRTLSLVNYDIQDNTLNQKECSIESDGNVVTKLIVEGVEMFTKSVLPILEKSREEMRQEMPYTENKKVSGDKTLQCLKPEVNRRKAFAYWHACTRIKEGVEKYSEQVNSLPLLIRNNGLGAALKYIQTRKNKDALGLIYIDICDWLLHDENELIKLEEGEELAEIIIDVKQDLYRDVTYEVLAYLALLRRFAKGLSTH